VSSLFWLPHLARPVARRKNVLRCVALVSCTKRSTTLRVAFLDPHIGIAEAYQLYLVALLRQHRKLLTLSRCPFRLVVSAEGFAPVE